MRIATRLTLAEFEELCVQGHFGGPERRMELLWGEVVDMSPPNPPHEDVVDLLNYWTIRKTSTKTIRVRIQNTIGIPELDSLPLPDVAWVKAKSYREQRPRTADVLLLIEVSDSSVDIDRNRKRSLYARAGIAEYWIVNIPSRQIEVFRDPVGEEYTTQLIVRGNETISPLCQPDAHLAPNDLGLR